MCLPPRPSRAQKRSLAPSTVQLEDDNDNNDNDDDTPEEDTSASSSTAGGGGGGKGRSKATKADDDALLASLVLARSAESATQQQTSLRAAPLLQVEAKHLDYAVELKRIFGSSIVRGASSRSLSRSPLLTA